MGFNARDIARIVFGWAPKERDAIRETAWLDGIRGVAAFLVMMAHLTQAWISPFADAPFGATVLSDRNVDGIWYFRKDTRLWAPWRLPIFRLFMSAGGGQVAIFFVVSGFVLTWGPLGSIQAGNHEKLYQSLGSSTIRRWFRLYIPCIIVTTAYLVHGVIKDYHGVVPALERIWGYVVMAEQWANPFPSAHPNPLPPIYGYNIVIWTIPVEFSGSLFVYVLLLVLGRVQSFPRRVSASVLISLYALFSLSWGLWLFGSGMVLADYVRYRGGFKQLSQCRSTIATVLWSICFTFGLVLLSFMPNSDWFTRPGYEWTLYVPLPEGWRATVGEERFWWGLGGILVIAGSCHLSLVRKFFELAFIQHLGKISFMLYLIHFLVNHTIAGPLRDAIYTGIGTKEHDDVYNGDVYRTTPIMNVGVFLVLWLIAVPIIMIVAHILETFVDRPVTALGKWLDEKLVNGVRREQHKKVLDEEEEQLLEPSRPVGLELNDIPQR